MRVNVQLIKAETGRTPLSEQQRFVCRQNRRPIPSLVSTTKQMAALLVSHDRPGFYFRVLEEGEVEAGDEIVRVMQGPEGMTAADVNAPLYEPGHPADRRCHVAVSRT
jgi:MOSC domain-containing protein YiiM